MPTPTQEDEAFVNEQRRIMNMEAAILQGKEISRQTAEHDETWIDKLDYYKAEVNKLDGIEAMAPNLQINRAADEQYKPEDAATKKQRKAIKSMSTHREEMEKAKILMKNIRVLESEAVDSRIKNLDDRAHNNDVDMGRLEEHLYSLRIEVADASKNAALAALEADVLTGAIPAEKEAEMKARIELRYQEDRVDAITRLHKLLPVNSEARKGLGDLKETEESKYSQTRKNLKHILKPEEKPSWFNRFYHSVYDASKAIMGLVHGANQFSHEGAVYVDEKTGKRLVNVGRAFMGGTKPMYVFEDPTEIIGYNQDHTPIYQQYLYKEAINCMGQKTPERAVLTEAASELQQIVCGDKSIPAFAVKDSSGSIVGTFQKRVMPYKGEPVRRDGADAPAPVQQIDLFNWQKNPDEQPLPPEITSQILREHMLDWLLCNFDTKGENFLQRAEDGMLVSIDKEASFSKIEDPGAQQMSSTYKGNMNDTIYNIMFQQFEKGKMADMNFEMLEPIIEKIEKIAGREFDELFKPFIAMKVGYGKENTPEVSKRYNAIVTAVSNRALGIRAEYERFITELIKKHLESNPESPMRQKLNAQGKFVFPQRLEKERQHEEEMRNATVEGLAMEAANKQIAVKKMNLPRIPALTKEERTYDAAMVRRCYEIRANASAHREGYWGTVGDQYVVQIMKSERIERRDADGAERSANAEKTKGSAELSSAQKNSAKADLENLFQNRLKDSMLDVVADYTMPPEMESAMNMCYLSQNYISALEIAYGAKKKFSKNEEEARINKDKSAKLSEIASTLKNSHLVAVRTLETLPRLAAWENTISMLEAEMLSKPGQEKYYQAMIDEARAKYTEEKTDYELFVKEDSFLRVPSDEPISFETYVEDMRKAKVFSQRGRLDEITRSFIAIDTKEVQTEEEAEARKQLIKQFEDIVVGSQDISTPEECFGTKVELSLTFTKKLNDDDPNEHESKIELAVLISELQEKVDIMKTLYDSDKKVTDQARMDELVEEALKLDRRIRVEEWLYGIGYKDAKEKREHFKSI